jgi:hypothetical protein
MDPALGAASPMPGGNSQGSGLAALPKRDEIPSSRSSMADSASEMSESDTDAMSLSGSLDSQNEFLIIFRNLRIFGLQSRIDKTKNNY